MWTPEQTEADVRDLERHRDDLLDAGYGERDGEDGFDDDTTEEEK